MDANQFDELVARFSDGPSRRDALKGALGGAMASIGVGAIAAADAEGKGKGKSRKSNGRGKARSQGDVDDEGRKKGKCNNKNKRRCGGKCKKIGTNQRCANCKDKCAVDEECIDRVCTPLIT